MKGRPQNLLDRSQETALHALVAQYQIGLHTLKKIHGILAPVASAYLLLQTADSELLEEMVETVQARAGRSLRHLRRIELTRAWYLQVTRKVARERVFYGDRFLAANYMKTFAPENETQRQVLEGLGRLEAQQQEYVVLSAFFGLTDYEIMIVLSTSEPIMARLRATAILALDELLPEGVTSETLLPPKE